MGVSLASEGKMLILFYCSYNKLNAFTVRESLFLHQSIKMLLFGNERILFLEDAMSSSAMRIVGLGPECCSSGCDHLVLNK